MPNTSLHSWHLGALVFCGLVPGIAGQVGWFDAGEFATAASGLGVAHPTGFPLFCVLAHALHLLPLGTLSFKLGLLCAASIALTTSLIHASAVELGAKSWPAAFGALFYPSVGVVWLHGQVVEVYALNVALIALLAWCLITPCPRWRLAAFMTGLGLGAHVTFALAALLLWLFSLTYHREWKRVIAWVPLGLWGALILLYLPAAASREPWLNWGNPSTLSAFWAHLSASGIRDAFADEMGVLGSGTWPAIVAWFENSAGAFWPLVVLTCLAALCWTRARWIWGLMMLMALSDAAFSVLMNPMGQADLQTGMPGAWAFAMALALLGAHVRTRTFWSRMTPLIVVALVSVTASSWAFKPAQEDTLSLRYGQSALLDVGPNGLALLSSDHLAGQLLYLQGIEGMRPDVVSLVIQHLPIREDVRRRYNAASQEVPAGFLNTPIDQQADALLALTRSEVGRTSVHWELGDSRFDPILTRVLRPGRVLYRLAPTAQLADAPLGNLEAPGGAFARTFATSSELALRSRRVLSDLSRHRGVWHLLRGELQPASLCLEDAYQVDATNPPALLNLAAVRRRQGRMNEALGLLEQALVLAPDYSKAQRNLERYQAELGSP